jgi:thymidylate synthase ThyX
MALAASARRTLSVIGRDDCTITLMDAPLRTGPPVVTLRNAWSRPYDGAIAAARTCYSPRVIGPEEVTAGQRDSIGPLTFEAGHHTVYQHAHFEFGLENVSRQFVWAFLHSHPFYNSEQSSQRFVRLDEVAAYVPPGLSGPPARSTRASWARPGRPIALCPGS